MLAKGAITELPHRKQDRGFTQAFFGPKEGRKQEASNKLQEPQQVGSSSSLQDGGPSYLKVMGYLL